jgi:hypothetical protein
MSSSSSSSSSQRKTLSTYGKDLRWKVTEYFARLLGVVALPNDVVEFTENIMQVADTGRVFITDHEGDFKYGKPFTGSDGQINYLPPAESESKPNAGFLTVSSRADRHGSPPLAVAPGHRYQRGVPDWFAASFVSRGFLALAVRHFTKYLSELNHRDRPNPRLNGEWTAEQLEAALPIAVQYVIPRGDKPMLAFLDFDDLPDQEESLIAIREKIHEELRSDVEMVCLSRKKSSGRYGAHVWLTNVYLPVSEIRRIAELIPGTDVGVYTPGHLFRAYPHQKIGTDVYAETNPGTLLKERLYTLNEHCTTPRLADEYAAIRPSCTNSHLGIRDIFCEKCAMKEMVWICKKIYAFQMPPKAILSLTEVRAVQLTSNDFRLREIPEPPTPFGVFHRLPPTHQSLQDIPNRIRKLVLECPRVFETWQSCVDAISDMYDRIEVVLGENVVRQPDGSVVYICQDDRGKVIRSSLKSSIETMISATYCVTMNCKDKFAGTAMTMAKELNRSISCGVSFSGKKECMTVKFDLSKMLKGFLGIGRQLDYIPYNPLLLHYDHGEDAEKMISSNSYVSWDVRECQPYMHLAKKRIDLEMPDGDEELLTLDEIAELMADSLKLMRRLFEDPKEQDNMRIFSLWISFLQVRLMFPAMANKLVVARPVPGNCVPPLCWYFTGDQGTGKSFWIISWLKMLFGDQFISLSHRVGGRFDFIERTSLFGICDELPADVQNGALINFLKRSTNAEQTMEKKGMDVQQVKAYHTVCLISNPYSKTEMANVFSGITFDDRRIIAVRGHRKLSQREKESITNYNDPRLAPIWRLVLTLGFSQTLKDEIVKRLPWAVFLIDQINDRVENASVMTNRYAIFGNWLSMSAPMTAIKQDILKAAARGPQRMVNLFANTGINMSAGMQWVEGHVRIDEKVWDGKYWLRLCSFSSLLSMYRAIAQSSYTDGRFSSGLSTTDFAMLLDEDNHHRLTWEEFEGLSPDEREDPEFSCTIDDTHIYFPARDVARANYEDNTCMVLDNPYVADVGIPRGPCYAAVGVAFGISQPINYAGKETAYTLSEVSTCRGLDFPHLSFDAVIAPIIAFDLKPEYTMVPAVAQAIEDFRKARGDQFSAYQHAERIAMARSSSATSSQEFTSQTPTRSAKRLDRSDDTDDIEDAGSRIRTPDLFVPDEWPSRLEAKRARR